MTYEEIMAELRKAKPSWMKEGKGLLDGAQLIFSSRAKVVNPDGSFQEARIDDVPTRNVDPTQRTADTTSPFFKDRGGVIERRVPIWPKKPREDEEDTITPPDDCCFYPADFPGITRTHFPSTDLPDALDLYIDGVFFTVLNHLDDTDDDGNPVYSYYDVTHTYGVSNFLEGWTPIGAGGSPTGQSCLVAINGTGTTTFEFRDQFLSTYTVDGTDVITRASATSCKWTGPKTGGGTWIMDYGSTTAYSWTLRSNGTSPTSDVKTAPQSSPVGSYGSHIIS